MVMWLRQSTADTVEMGTFVDDADGKTPETALTITQSDCQLIKNGGASAQKNSASAATNIGGGQYGVPLDATDTGTLGRLRLYINKTGALPLWRDFLVVSANVYAGLILGSDRLQVHTDEMTPGVITSATIATDAIDGDAVATSAVAEFQSGLATSAALAVVNAYVDELESRLTAARAGYLDNLNGGPAATAAALSTVAGYIDTEVAAILAAVDTEVAAILAKVINLPASPAATGSAMTLAADAVNAAALAASAVAEIQAGLSTLTPAQVNAEVVDALSVDTYGEPSAPPAATSSLKDKIGWLFMMARNKRLTTAGADRVRNDADSADVGTATLSDDGSTFTRNKYS